MEEDPGSGFSRLHVDWNHYDWRKPDMRFNTGNPNISSPFQNTTPFLSTTPATVSTDYVLPPDGLSGLPHPRMYQSGEHLGWFYCLPRYRQAFAPATRNIPSKDDFSVGPSGNCVNPGKPYEGFDASGSPKFFVFNQSGDQATLIFGPETNGVPIPQIPMATPKQLGVTVTGDEGQGGETASKGQDENKDVDVHSEMHEDTEELNALLYSDEESDYSGDGDDDDEVTSTGHSPSTMTDHLDRSIIPSEKGSEEVASSLWPPSKKRKLVNECHDLLPFRDTSAAENLIGNFGSDDAVSSSGDCRNISRNIAIKRARIYETISVLQSLVPSVKGKNPVVIIDEGIEYLKSLKLKAAALGLGQV